MFISVKMKETKIRNTKNKETEQNDVTDVGGHVTDCIYHFHL